MCARKIAPLRARSLSGGSAARALAACARRVVLDKVGSCPMKAHCPNEMAISLGKRPCSDVPTAASNKQLSCACAQELAPLRALSLSGGGAARALAACARCAALVGVGPCPLEAHCASETPLFLGARPCSVVPAAASNKQLSCACAQEKAPPRALSLSGGSAAGALAACARRAALVGVGSCPMEAPCASKTALSHGARPCSNVPAAASDRQLSCACAPKKRYRARSLSRLQAQHARLRRARAAPRWLESVPALWKLTAPARRPSPSMHGRAPTCQPRPPTSSCLAHVRKKNATARAFPFERRHSMRACGVRAPRRAGLSRSAPYGSSLRQRDGPLRRCTAALRRASSGFQQAAFLRMRPRKSATARALSLGRRRSTRACAVRAPRRAGWRRSVPYGSPPRQRNGPLPRCTAALRRASRGLQQAAFLRMCARKCATARALSLRKRRSTRARGMHAPRHAGRNWLSCSRRPPR